MPIFEMDVVNGHITAQFGEWLVPTGGQGEPTAFDMFLSGLGSCTAATLAGYCRAQELPHEGLKVIMDVERNLDTRMVSLIKMQIVPPAGFPVERKAELAQVAERCSVKRHLFAPPQFETTVID